MEFIKQIHDVIPKEICEKIIDRYKEDKRQELGGVAGGQINREIRRSRILEISEYEDWKDFDSIIYESLTCAYKKYVEMVDTPDIMIGDVKDEGYTIQEMGKGDFYDWHHDDSLESRRILSCLLYLNDVDEKDGGSTDFKLGCSIQPKQGSVLFFPSGWTYIHRGAPVTGDTVKYTIVTWIGL